MGDMDASVFITLSYAATAILLGGLSLISWVRYRAVTRQLGEQQK